MKKKVLFVIYNLSSGGAERAVSIISKLLTERHEVSILNFEDSKPHYEIDSKINLIQIKFHELNRFKKYKKLATIFKEFDVIISFMTSTNNYSLISNLFSKRKIIISERTDPRAHQPLSKSRLLSFLSYQFAYSLVVQTYSQKKYFKLFLKKSKIKVIPNFTKKIKKFRTDRGVNFLNIGRLEFEKNQLELIKAFQISNLDCNLYIIGEGSKRGLIESYIKKQNIENVILIGEEKEIKKYFYLNWIFISSSLYEGFPNALIEAMSFGMPCIHSKFNGIEDIIENEIDGLIYNQGDINGLVNRMKLLYQNKNLRDNLSKNAYLKSLNFSEEKIIEKWLELIEN